MSLFVILGLKNYGFHRLASDLAYQNTKMVFDELEKYGHFREYFNSVDGSGVDLVDYIWTAMPAYFIVNVFLGIEPRGDGLAILPALPSGRQEAGVENLCVRGKRVSVRVEVDASAAETYAELDGEPAPVSENRGVVIPWGQLPDSTHIRIVQPSVIPEAHAAPLEAP